MPNNTGLLLLGLGALLFLGRGGTGKQVDKDNRIITGSGGGGMPLPPIPAFDIAGYVDSLFSQTATVPVQPPAQFFFPPSRVVTSSGVPAVINPPPDIITPTTKVMIGGAGGETITASSLEIIRTEQIAKQAFAHAANADLRTSPEGKHYFYAATLEANRIENERQKEFARDLIAKNRAAQAKTREQQEAAIAQVSYIPPTIGDFSYTGDGDGLSFGSTVGQPIADPYRPSPIGDFSYIGDDEVDSSDTTFYEGPTVFAGEEEDIFVTSEGLGSPTVFAGEEEDTFSSTGVQDYGYGAYYGGSEDE
jgi:hypothetical protein